MSSLEMVNTTSTMTTYEKWAIALSIIAILIPVVQFIWKTFIQQPKLNYYTTGSAHLFCNKSGSYIQVEGVFESLKQAVSVKNVSIEIVRDSDNKSMCLSWSVFVSPINQRFMGVFASANESAHPFRIEANQISCAFIEFSDSAQASTTTIEPEYNRLIRFSSNLRSRYNICEDAISELKQSDEYSIAKKARENELFWKADSYKAIVSAQYGKKTKSFPLTFDVSEQECTRIHQNIEELLLVPIKECYGLKWQMQPVTIRVKQ